MYIRCHNGRFKSRFIGR